MLTALSRLWRGLLLLAACLSSQASGLKTVTLNQGGEGKAPKHITLSNDAPLQHELLICNAYASRKPMAVYRLRESRSITGDVPLAYKECRNFGLNLEENDSFEFRTGDLKVGTFATTDLPKASTTLLLVPVRRSSEGLVAKFMSHAFIGNGGTTAQVAVVDAFRPTAISSGSKQGAAVVQIADRGGDGDGAEGRRREEDLHFDSVVALGPGRYELALVNSSSQLQEHIALQTSESSRHVIMRVGLAGGNATDAASYPEELVVFPQFAAKAGTDAKEEASAKSTAAPGASPVLGTAVAAVAAAALLVAALAGGP